MSPAPWSRASEPASAWPSEADFRREFFACLALRHTPGVGPRTAKALVSGYPTAYEAIRDASSWPGRKLASKRQSRAFLDEAWRVAAEREYAAARAVDLRVLLFSEPGYPRRLWDIPDPPLFVYFEGNLDLLRGPAVAVVGSRQCTRMGLSATEAIASALSRAGVTIVSGLAQGIDRQAHLSGLSGPGSSIAVMGTGLHVDYPPQNADLRRAMGARGLVLTEHPPGTRPLASNFPVRNRIISGLSLGVLVAEAAQRSGSLITARLALDHGREVFALPGPCGQPSFTGCHQLIKNGALLVDSAEDILVALRPHLAASLPGLAPVRAAPAPGPEGTPAGPGIRTATPAADRPRGPGPAPGTPEDRVLKALGQADRTHIDALAEVLDWEAPAVSRALLLLEMQGLVRQWPGMYYGLT